MSRALEISKEISGKGEFVRQESVFRHMVVDDPSAEFAAEKNRYHLYVSLACPWAHRTIIVRELKGLHSVVGMTVVDPIRDSRGWRFSEGSCHSSDPLHGWNYLSEAYKASDPSFEGRVSVPVLWDKESGVIVNNESGDVSLMLNSVFDRWAKHPQVDLYPKDLRPQIDDINKYVYEHVSNGVYRAGFATAQDVYESAFDEVFSGLDMIESKLANQRYLVGDKLTIADWRLWTTLVRFDVVYHGHFKCNLRRIVDYPNIWGFVRDLYQQPGIASTLNMDHIKRHYYVTQAQINPNGIVPKGPILDFDTPHGREAIGCS